MKLSEEKLLSDSQSNNLISQKDYSSVADYLFNAQVKSWPLMEENYNALKNIQTKSFWFERMKLKGQFNPERIKSTSAKIDESSLASRACFLCSDNLPLEQKGILIREDFIILCNPYPIFSQHFTIASLVHKPQQISDSFSEFLEISKLLSPNYTLIYNGPACGASAPDHLHFQAGTRQSIPIENDIQQMKNDFGQIVQQNELITTTFINDGLRKIIFIESVDQSLIDNCFGKILFEYGNLYSADSEPMINLLCYYDKEFGWNIIVFLRSRHRPGYFYKNDFDKILISPAAVDIGGLIITPRKEDFDRVDKELVKKIFNEVSLDQKTFSILAEKIIAELS